MWRWLLLIFFLIHTAFHRYQKLLCTNVRRKKFQRKNEISDKLMLIFKKFIKFGYSVSHPSSFISGKNWLCRLNIPYPNVLGTRSVSHFELFRILEYLCINDEISWAWDPNLNSGFICVYTSYILKVILHSTFSVPAFWLWPVTWGQE